MPMSLTLFHHVSGPITGSLVVAVYDYFLKEYFTNKNIAYDVLCIFTSLLSTNILKNVVVDNILPISEDSIQNKLIKIIMNAVLYSYLYDYFLGNLDNSSAIGLSQQTEKVLIASVSYLSSIYLENPLFNLFNL